MHTREEVMQAVYSLYLPSCPDPRGDPNHDPDPDPLSHSEAMKALTVIRMPWLVLQVGRYRERVPQAIQSLIGAWFAYRQPWLHA